MVFKHNRAKTTWQFFTLIVFQHRYQPQISSDCADVQCLMCESA